MLIHHPEIIYHGPCAEHDMACAVCHFREAVLDCSTGNFQPCWTCQKAGWLLTAHKASWWERLFRRSEVARVEGKP